MGGNLVLGVMFFCAKSGIITAFFKIFLIFLVFDLEVGNLVLGSVVFLRKIRYHNGFKS